MILVGGGNSAGQAALFFADYARSVTILIRGGEPRGVDVALPDRRARAQAERAVRTGGEIVRCAGDDRLERVDDPQSRRRVARRGSTDAVFIFIGADAETGWLPGRRSSATSAATSAPGRDVVDLMPDAWPLERDPYLLETSVPGIFAAGDVRHG